MCAVILFLNLLLSEKIIKILNMTGEKSQVMAIQMT